MTELYLPNLELGGDYVFARCFSLSELLLGPGVKLGKGSITGCKAL